MVFPVNISPEYTFSIIITFEEVTDDVDINSIIEGYCKHYKVDVII